MFLYTNSESIIWKRNQENISISKSYTRKLTYLRINWTKELKVVNENWKSMMKEIEEDTKKQKHISFPWTGRISLIKLCLLTKGIYRLNTISTKILMTCFPELEMNILNMAPQMNLNSHSDLKQKELNGRHSTTWL